MTTPQKTWSHICSFTFSVVSLHLLLHGSMSLYRVEGVKCVVVCCFQGRIFSPTNLLNHKAPFYRIDAATVSNLIVIITAFFRTFAFNMVVWWCKLGEVENEYTSHSFSLFAIFLPKFIKIGGNLTTFWRRQFCTVFFKHGVDPLMWQHKSFVAQPSRTAAIFSYALVTILTSQNRWYCMSEWVCRV